MRQGTPVRLRARTRRRGTFNQRHTTLIDTETEARLRPSRTFRSSSRGSKPTIPLFRRLLFWDSSMVSAATIPKRWSCGRRNSAILPMARRSSSISLLPRAKTSGICCPGSCCCCRTVTKGRGRSIRARAWSGSCSLRRATICKSANPRPRRNISTCSAARPAGWRKPLVVFTPKGMLRHPVACSSLAGLDHPSIPAGDSRLRRWFCNSRVAVYRQNQARA